MDSQELTEQFIKFNKLLGLRLFNGVIQDYQACTSVLPEVSFVGQFNYLNRGVLMSVDPRIIASITNRCFGGRGEINEFKAASFSMAEKFIGKEIVQLVELFFSQKDIDVKCGRVDENLGRVHMFFSDEQVLFMDMKCRVGVEEAGSMAFVYPIQFIKQEQSKWLATED